MPILWFAGVNPGSANEEVTGVGVDEFRKTVAICGPHRCILILYVRDIPVPREESCVSGRD